MAGDGTELPVRLAARRTGVFMKKRVHEPNTLRAKMKRASSRAQRLNNLGLLKTDRSVPKPVTLPKLKCLEEKDDATT